MYMLLVGFITLFYVATSASQESAIESEGRSDDTHLLLQIKSLPLSSQRLYGPPAVAIAPGWMPHDSSDIADCHVQHLATGYLDGFMLACSTGGYDRCSERLACGAPFWSKEFVVKFSEHKDGDHHEAADVVIADWPMKSLDVPTAENQSRTILTMESSLNPELNITKAAYAKENIDFSFGFHKGLMTEQTSFFLSDPRLLYDHPIVPFESREKRALAVSCISFSNGASREFRKQWLLSFSERVPTHNLCGVGHNVPEDAALGPYPAFSPEGPRDKVEHMRNYKFCIARENFIEGGYVTEKLYDCLRSGSIPIYAGAQDVDRIWPYASESILNVRDFNGMDQLAARVHDIASNATLFNSFHAWRTYPVPPSVMNVLFHGLSNVLCRACVKHQRRISGMSSPEAPEWWSSPTQWTGP